MAMPDHAIQPERRTRLLPDARRAQLVALGVAALADRTLESLPLEELSKQAGVSKGLLFYYFGSKQGFHREIVSAAFNSMLHATEPLLELPPAERLWSTLRRTVRFAREHESTFYSLVRGTASGDAEVREVIEHARATQAERVLVLFLELGIPDSGLLRIAVRSWVAFAEQTLVDAALNTDMSDADIVQLLTNSLVAITTAIDPAHGESLSGVVL
ncbi:TetR/AcrR family transcriptional regulator [Subtercola frigoramans]|uniref:AcrR family transcriptional regulator n=1 Tax=Subtercola frigoramans TaxID=120298 RepID=A0ABS2L7L5_9MICO|nr:TetR/AcrR family transcriptional regulator [Subtercola frigoramans]MBM7473072.1 AcrR family transcriptional regulator [Subtercola frigoramans]